MALTLNARKGTDTLKRLEAAVTRRHAEALSLAPTEPLGAIYLFGYTIEIRLKCAYYRLEGIPLNHNLNAPLPGNIDSPFKLASMEIKRLLGPTAPNTVGHHLPGWGSLVIAARAGSPLGSFDVPFRKALLLHTKNVFLCWSEILRYRANKPYDKESEAVADAAQWLRKNYRRLWS